MWERVYEVDRAGGNDSDSAGGYRGSRPGARGSSRRKAASQAQDAVQGTEQAVDQFLYEAQNAGQNGPKSTVLAKEKGKATEKEERTSKVIIPESGGISIGNVALLTIGVSSLIIGVWLFARRATRYVSLPQVPVVAARSLLLSGSR